MIGLCNKQAIIHKKAFVTRKCTINFIGNEIPQRKKMISAELNSPGDWSEPQSRVGLALTEEDRGEVQNRKLSKGRLQAGKK